MTSIIEHINRRLAHTMGVQVVRSAFLDNSLMMVDHHSALANAAKEPLPPDLEERILLLGRLLKPRQVTSHRKIRVGGREDGGYVMLDDFDGLQTAFSLGVGPNVDWDHAVAERGIDIHQFDHTVDGPPRKHARFHFHQRRIDANRSAGTENIASLLENYGSAANFSNVLKIDIENSEWPLFANTTPDDLAKFPQILCEFHSLGYVDDDSHFRLMTDALLRLREVFEIVHVHGNNCGGRVFAAGRAFPHVLEVTLANKSKYRFADSEESFPTPLDAPNDTGKPDYFLGDFNFGSFVDRDTILRKREALSGEEPPGFDRQAYLEANPDVKAAGMDAWTHWRRFGKGEGRPLSPEEADFEPDAYLAANPDVAASGFDALAHWRHFGRREGRPLSLEQRPSGV